MVGEVDDGRDHCGLVPLLRLQQPGGVLHLDVGIRGFFSSSASWTAYGLFLGPTVLELAAAAHLVSGP
jgi:hypothetical protein